MLQSSDLSGMGEFPIITQPRRRAGCSDRCCARQIRDDRQQHFTPNEPNELVVLQPMSVHDMLSKGVSMNQEGSVWSQDNGWSDSHALDILKPD
jgi:hypothetical protein